MFYYYYCVVSCVEEQLAARIITGLIILDDIITNCHCIDVHVMCAFKTVDKRGRKEERGKGRERSREIGEGRGKERKGEGQREIGEGVEREMLVLMMLFFLQFLVLLNVINQEQSTKQMCTRALWCLANHNLQNSIILPHVS